MSTPATAHSHESRLVRMVLCMTTSQKYAIDTGMHDSGNLQQALIGAVCASIYFFIQEAPTPPKLFAALSASVRLLNSTIA